ncbi:hypothetical protein B0H13DRAFT_1871245 [Mycena leptocephala]|nr:hypothetical protein B0H13DRAFT_1871245 [Mycena leptocephala]
MSLPNPDSLRTSIYCTFRDIHRFYMENQLYKLDEKHVTIQMNLVLLNSLIFVGYKPACSVINEKNWQEKIDERQNDANTALHVFLLRDNESETKLGFDFAWHAKFADGNMYTYYCQEGNHKQFEVLKGTWDLRNGLQNKPPGLVVEAGYLIYASINLSERITFAPLSHITQLRDPTFPKLNQALGCWFVRDPYLIGEKIHPVDPFHDPDLINLSNKKYIAIFHPVDPLTEQQRRRSLLDTFPKGTVPKLGPDVDPPEFTGPVLRGLINQHYVNIFAMYRSAGLDEVFEEHITIQLNLQLAQKVRCLLQKPELDVWVYLDSTSLDKAPSIAADKPFCIFLPTSKNLESKVGFDFGWHAKLQPHGQTYTYFLQAKRLRKDLDKVVTAANFSYDGTKQMKTLYKTVEAEKETFAGTVDGGIPIQVNNPWYNRYILYATLKNAGSTVFTARLVIVPIRQVAAVAYFLESNAKSPTPTHIDDALSWYFPGVQTLNIDGSTTFEMPFGELVADRVTLSTLVKSCGKSCGSCGKPCGKWQEKVRGDAGTQWYKEMVAEYAGKTTQEALREKFVEVNKANEEGNDYSLTFP